MAAYVPLSGVSTGITRVHLGEAAKRMTKVHLVQITAEVATQVRQQLQARGDFPAAMNDYLTIVDRREGHGREYAVRPGGQITYWNNSADLSEVLTWIAEKLVKLSPVGLKRSQPSESGWRREHYQDAHLYMIDGVAVQEINKQSTIVGFKQTYQTKKHTKDSQHQFVNTMVYARRIENGGTTSNNNYVKPWSSYAPSGVYRTVAKLADARFGRTIRVGFKVLQLNIGREIYSGTEHAFNQFYPTIVVRPRATTKQALGTLK